MQKPTQKKTLRLKPTGAPDGRQLCGKCRKNKTQCACGRPRAITVETKKSLVQAFHDSFTIADACKFAGIAEKTYYNEGRHDPKFLLEMELAQLYPEVLIRKNIIKTATHDARIGIEYLSRKRKAEWSTSNETKATVTVQLRPLSERAIAQLKRFNGGEEPIYLRASQKTNGAVLEYDEGQEE